MVQKLTSRKFWFCVAAFLASISTGVAGLASGNEVVTGIGIGCGILSAAIYAACEAATDVAGIKSETTTTTRNITATASDKAVVQQVLTPDTPKEQ